MKNTQLQVTAIKEGTVIDHIPAKDLYKVINILGLSQFDNPMTIGSNFESAKLGRKSIIKVSNYFFKDDEINKIALVAPHAKLNIIKDYQVAEKKVVEVPEKVHGITKCMNPNCITNHEAVLPKFTVIKKNDVQLKCLYCEKITDKEHMQIE